MEVTTKMSSTILDEAPNRMNMAFSWYDYILFCGMLGASALIGIYFGCFGSKQATASEYLMGGKKMKVFPISMSLVASHISGITLLALPADVYRFGAAYWNLAFSLFFVTGVTIYVFLPVFYKLQITSTYEYLERRFDNRNRMFASFLFALSMFLYLPIVIYIPALAFSAATGVNVHLITPLVCGVCIFYTTIGGLKAVVWTDTLQFTITIGAVITVVFLGVRSIGGVSTILMRADEGHRLDIFDFDPDPTKRDSFWAVFIGLTVGWISMTSINQSCVQKFLSVSTLNEARQAVVYFCFGVVGITSFSIFTGLIMYAKYAKCDPFATGAVDRNDQLLPYYVMDVAGDLPGLPGIFIAGVFCAALSTLSASLNCLAGTVYEDFISKILQFKTKKEKIEEIVTNRILKLIVVVIGLICVALVFVIEHLGGILPLAISLGGVTAGPLLGMFTLGVLFPKATSRGTFYGSIIGLVFASWIVIMAQYYKTRGFIVYEPKPTSTENCDTLTIVSNLFSSNLNESLNVLNEENIRLPVQNISTFTTEGIAMAINTTDTINEKFTYQPFFLFRISYYYYCLLGTSVTIITGLLISCFDKSTANSAPVSRDLLSPAIYFLLKDDKFDPDRVQYSDIPNANLNLTTASEKHQDDKA